ncbi:MAG: nitroreductase family protein [Candidatus Kapabacteria bacterium]|nr:nitroreductase family protein [Candidatus Kapabacteria bacterium]
METIVAIKTRRSIRKFKDREVSIELIKELLDAAMMAPSAGNQQPWHFIILQDREKLNTIATEHPYAKMLPETPVAIVVCGDPDLDSYNGSWPIDCSAATQNILLAAHDYGLGAVWIGVYPNKDRINLIRRVCNIPDKIFPLAVIAIGWPAEKRSTFSRFKIERVHFDNWDTVSG